MASTLLRLHQSSSLLDRMDVIEYASDAEIFTCRSNDYSKNAGINSDWKALLLNKVVVGNGKKLTQNDTSLTGPPQGHDSVSVFGLVFL